MRLAQHSDRDARRLRPSSLVQPPRAPADDSRSGRTLHRSVIVLLICLLALGLVAIGVGMLGHSAAEPDVRGKQTATTVDPRLILRPQTVSQSQQLGGLRLQMTVSPLIPGVNHFALRIDNGSQPISQAAVTATATMLGMVMRPLHVTFAAVAGGRYAAAGALPMFGQWQITLKVRQAHGGTLTTLFPVSLDLPAGLFSSPPTQQK